MTTGIEVLRFDEIGLQSARDEGEGFESVDDRRRAHTRFWESDEMRAELGQPESRVTEDSVVVAEWPGSFRSSDDHPVRQSA
jgi:uncharacterized protein YhfF